MRKLESVAGHGVRDVRIGVPNFGAQLVETEPALESDALS
jgi:hypothetical protein